MVCDFQGKELIMNWMVETLWRNSFYRHSFLCFWRMTERCQVTVKENELRLMLAGRDQWLKAAKQNVATANPPSCSQFVKLYAATVTHLFFPCATFLYFMTLMFLHINGATKISIVTAPSHVTLTHLSCTSPQAVGRNKATVSRLPIGWSAWFLFVLFFFNFSFFS